MPKYKHTVFMSYAHDDDIGWARWITKYDEELNRGLQSRLRELNLPQTHLSSKNGPINGPLGKALKDSIDASFAMIVFVHDGYLRSPWCLQELKYFRDLHGPDGFRARLFIVAMSRRAIDILAKRPEWLDLFPDPDPVWMRFHQRPEDLPNQPIGMFLRDPQGTDAVMATEFLQPFFQLREKLVETFQEAADLDPDLFKSAEPALRAAPIPAGNLEVLAFIESEPGEEGYWEPLGRQVKQAWDQVVALEPQEQRLRLRPTGLPMHDLHNRPRLDGADGVILLWGEKAQESLLAQIALVEPRLAPPNVAPGLIAYLMTADVETAADVPETIQHWPVVRFAIRRGDQGSATVVAEDAPKLTQYLSDVLAHKRRAQAAGLCT
jgi:TIR domain